MSEEVREVSGGHSGHIFFGALGAAPRGESLQHTLHENLVVRGQPALGCEVHDEGINLGVHGLMLRPAVADASAALLVLA